MKGARIRALVLAVSIMALAALAFAQLRRSPPAAAGERPTLLLLTSLPLMFGEEFSIDGNGSPALEALQNDYRVVPISVASPRELAKGGILLMAQPTAQRPEDLVALDDWVRQGGLLLLLADPMLEWPSDRPLGDRLRPPMMFMDTGLLVHWGLRLDAPEARGVTRRVLGGKEIETASPGSLWGGCEISRDRLVARCAVGKGRVTVVADADFLNVEALEGPNDDNLPALNAEIAALK